MVTSLSDQIDADILPLDLVRDKALYGRLRGHVSRSNPLWEKAKSGIEALVVFQGPNAYISPRWYVNGTKSGRNAPSWNYVTVHAYGSLQIIEDPDWMQAHLQALTIRHEKERENPWTLESASPDFVTQMIKGVVGFEIPITRIVGKWFLSQHRTQADKDNLALALSKESAFGSKEIANLIRAQCI